MSKQQEQEQVPLEGPPDEITKPLDEGTQTGPFNQLGITGSHRFNVIEAAQGRVLPKPYHLIHFSQPAPILKSDIDSLATAPVPAPVLNDGIDSLATAPVPAPSQQKRFEVIATIKMPAALRQSQSLTATMLESDAIKQLTRLRRYSRPLFVAALCLLLLILLAAGVLEGAQLQQVHQYVSVVNAQSGALQWQSPETSSLAATSTSGENSLLIRKTGQQHEQLVALDANGNTLWSIASGQQQASFMLPDIATPPGTVLVELNGQPDSTLAANGATTLQRLLILSLLNRATGHILWQHAIVAGGAQFGAALLGGDSRNVYIAFAETGSAQHPSSIGITLLAMQQQTGAIAWGVHGPSSTGFLSDDTGKLLLYGQDVYWQVAGTMYALNNANGRILWHQSIAEGNVAALPQEESTMMVIGGMLIVERSTIFYKMNPANGAGRGTIPNPEDGTSIQHQLVGSGVAASGTTMVIYGNGQIAAYNVLTNQELWSQQQIDSLRSVTVSHDGKLAFVLLTDSVEGSQPAQALVALDMATGTARWTFQPSKEVTFMPLSPTNYFQYAPDVLLTSVCLSAMEASCAQPYLYALNAQTGAVLWKLQNYALSNVSLSADGQSAIFERTSSGWLDLMQRL
jgi:outer membrane protein assembly factor BamB